MTVSNSCILPLPIPAQTAAGAAATPTSAGEHRGDPSAGSALGHHAEKHQEFTGENFPSWDYFTECLTPERTSHIAELKHLINTDESVTVWWGWAVFRWKYVKKKPFADPSKMPEWDPPS